MKIGVISDTHGFLDPRVFELFTGVSHILHAGDIGPDALIAELETIAPVTAVIGNTDSSSLFQLTETATLAGRKFLVHHIVDPYALREELRLRVARECPERGGVWSHAQDLLRNGQRRAVFQSRLGGQTEIGPGPHGGHSALRRQGNPAGISGVVNK